MIDINFLRANPDAVRENIRKKFQDKKLPLVDEVLALDEQRRALQREGDERRARRNALSAQIGKLMKEKNTEEAARVKGKPFLLPIFSYLRYRKLTLTSIV